MTDTTEFTLGFLDEDEVSIVFRSLDRYIRRMHSETDVPSWSRDEHDRTREATRTLLTELRNAANWPTKHASPKLTEPLTFDIALNSGTKPILRGDLIVWALRQDAGRLQHGVSGFHSEATLTSVDKEMRAVAVRFEDIAERVAIQTMFARDPEEAAAREEHYNVYERPRVGRPPRFVDDPDLDQQLHAVGSQLRVLDDRRATFEPQRTALIRQALADGWTHAQIAEAAHCSRALVGKIASAQD